MAKKGISIPVASDTRDFATGIKQGVVKPLEGVEDTLDDLARGGKSAGDKLENALEGAQKETEQLAREHKDLGRVIRDEAAKNSRAVKRGADDGFRGAGGAASEFKQEALQNFSEVTSSFDGSMNSVQDLAQGTLGGLASGIAGPIGLAAGAAAVGIGLIGAAVEGLGNTTEADQEKVGEWAQAYIEAGQTILTSAQSTAKALDIITDPDKFKEAQTAAEDWGVTTATAVAALSGNQWAIDAVTASVGAMNTKLEDFKKLDSGPTSDTYAAFKDLSEQYETATSKLSKLNGEMGAGKKQAEVYSQYLRELALNTADATKKTDEFGDSVYSLPDGTTIYIDAETGQATSDTDAIEQKIYSLNDKTVTIGADTSPAQQQINELFRNTGSIKIRLDPSDVKLLRRGTEVR